MGDVGRYESERRLWSLGRVMPQSVFLLSLASKGANADRDIREGDPGDRG
jgi:hypothetical protein